MNIIQHISVKPSLPRTIGRLDELAHNLVWSWLPGASDLFEAIDPEIWSATIHNPILLLSEASQGRLDQVAKSKEYLDKYSDVFRSFDEYMSPDATTWFNLNHPDKDGRVIAYFSAEYGLHESLPIYSGGLGILSGDHLKEASDLGLPLVGIGFLYPQGYFQQRLDSSGWQHAHYDHLPFEILPVKPALGNDGRQITVSVDLPARLVYIRAWKIQVGRCNVYFMDTDVEQNSPADRQLSHRLYHGDEETRVAWETVFGLGGVRLLRALGLEPAVWHMNEGHSAFMGLERIRELVAHHGLTFSESVEVVRSNTVFTTHTPVPAGNDTFAYDLIEKYFSRFWSQLGTERDEFLAFARQDLDWQTRYSMTVLALRLSGHANGVSQLHGDVSRSMWQFVWPSTPRDEIPIVGITNGVHAATWIPQILQRIFRKYLGSDCFENIHTPQTWRRLDEVPDDELWDAHEVCKRSLSEFAQQNLLRQGERFGENTAELVRGKPVLNPEALVIGFARRFATYKRATLILRDIDRLRDLVNNPERPMQFVFAGKAHPADDAGKHFIQHLFQLSRDPGSGFKDRFIFLENYDIRMARKLVAGVDIWLNTPRRPHEASGTSGEKAAMCGVPHFSVLDGWWAEGFNGRNGWAIGSDIAYGDEVTQDESDAASFYETLEHDILPLFFNRGVDGVPHQWLKVMKESIRSCAPAFSFRRMLHDYCQLLYFPALEAGQVRNSGNFERSVKLAAWLKFMRVNWPHVSFEDVHVSNSELTVGNTVEIEARLNLGPIPAAEAQVEVVVYRHSVDSSLNLLFRQSLDHSGTSEGLAVFKGDLCPQQNGSLGLGVRIRPAHPDLISLSHSGLVTWAETSHLK